MRELLSHSLPSGRWDQVQNKMQTKTQNQAQSKNTNNTTKSLLPNGSKLPTPKEKSQNHTVSVGSKSRQYIPIATQRAIFQRDQCCQYKDKHTGKQCRSHWQLSIDHIQPIWAGGTNEITNLRVLCANHNRHVYKQQANITAH